MANINLPTDLLRTFISIVDLGGYTKAAQVLGRTQPAISLQMSRLQTLLQCQLFNNTGKRTQLTEQGETLAMFARQMLRLNDEAVAKFTQPAAQGILRVGLPMDFAVEFLQSAISTFAHAHDKLELEILCDLSSNLLDLLHRDQLDIAVAILPRHDNQYLARSWLERPIWAAVKNSNVHHKNPVPLVVHPEGCEYRNRMIAALSRSRKEWRIAYSSPDIAGIQQAVSAGLGITALTRKTLSPEMRALGEDDGFPPLETIRIGLFYKQSRLPDAGSLLVSTLLARMEEAAGPGDPA